MKLIKFDKIHNGQDIYVNEDILCGEPFFVDADGCPDLYLIRVILEHGNIIVCDNIFQEMFLLENEKFILNCSFSNLFLETFMVWQKFEQKGRIGCIGKTTFYINSNENNHSYTPHFHVSNNGLDFSFKFDGSQLAGNMPHPSISKRIKEFLKLPGTNKKLNDEWNKNTNNKKMLK